MSATVFVHLGDTHLYDGLRQADRLAALDQVIAEGEAIHRLGAWIWPGDLFHQRSTISTRNALKDRLLRMATIAPVVLCYGNHDVPGDLDIFGVLEAHWPIIVVAKPQVVRVRLATELQGVPGQVASVFALPYPTAASLIARGVAQPDVPAAARAALEGIFVKAGQDLTEARRRGDWTLMIGHADVTGAVRHVGQPAIGEEIALDGALLAHLGGCPVLLNHIHYAQDIAGASFAGSLCRMDWGEVEPKSYSVLHYTRQPDGRGASQLLSFRIERRPIAVAPMWHCEAWLTRGGVVGLQVTTGQGGEALATPSSWAGCDVRLRARYKQSEEFVLAEAQAQACALFQHARRFEFEPICEPDRAVRAPEVAAARTLPEKVAAWARINGTVLSVSLASKLGLLETTDADTLVGSVERYLTSVRFGTSHAAAADASGEGSDAPKSADASGELRITAE